MNRFICSSVIVYVLFACSGCGDGIVISSSLDPKVENGCAYEKGTLDVRGIQSIVLPKDAIVHRVAPAGQAELYLEKYLGFAGHPGEAISIRDARKNMGCAYRIEGDKLVLGTYGEWDSHIEGGAGIRMLVRVPPTVRIELRESLSGEKSEANPAIGSLLTLHKTKTGSWYGPSAPRDRWTIVATVPDTYLIMSKL